jgi:DNA-directed RNA polymerase II subunit RPB9
MSASPAPSDADQPANKGQEQITFRFCREWYVISHSPTSHHHANDPSSSNMLYPKEDRFTNTLMFSCRTCPFSEPAASSCVFRNNLYNTVGETAGVTQDVGADPTVGSPDFVTCTLCGEEIVCFLCGQGACSGFVGSVPEDYEEDTTDDLSGEDISEECEMQDLYLDENYDDEEDSMESVEVDAHHWDKGHMFTVGFCVQCS